MISPNNNGSRLASPGPWIRNSRLIWGAVLLLGSLDCLSTVTNPAAKTGWAASELPAGQDAEERAIAEAGPTLRIHRTAHFSIISNCPASTVAALGREAERTYDEVYAFAAGLRISISSPPYKLIVVFLDEWEQFASRARAAGLPADQTAPGFFSSAADRCVLFNFAHAEMMRQKRLELAAAKLRLSLDEARALPAEEREQARRQIRSIEETLAEQECLVNQMVVRHEIAHQVLRALGIPTLGLCERRWLVEGLAMQFETASRPGLSPYRLMDLAAQVDDEFDVRSMVANPEDWDQEMDQQRAAYALAGALVSFLIERKPDAFAQYVQAAPAPSRATGGAGQACLAGFERAFGPLSHSFEVEFRRYVQELKQRPPN